MKAQWSGVKIKDMFPDAQVQMESPVEIPEVRPAPSNANLDLEPPPLVYDQQFTDFNESCSSSSKSIRLPRSMLREVTPPTVRQKDGDSEQELHLTPREEELLDFVNNNAVSVNAASAESEVLISQSDPVSRLRAYSKLQNAPVGAKKFVPLSFVPEAEEGRGPHDRHIEISAAVSAAMGAALPYFRGQADLEHQMRLLLEKVTNLEEAIKANTILNDAREASAVNFERHLAELTEKRLQLLERVMESEQKLDLKSFKHEETLDESSRKQMYPVNFIETCDHNVPKYTRVPTEPRTALLAKSSSKNKKKESPSKQKVSNDSSILPRSTAPKPTTPSAELLSEILREQNDSSLHTINASIINETERKQLDDSRARGAESKILDELSRLREELYSLKYKRDSASKSELSNEMRTLRPPQETPRVVMPAFQEELMPNLTKPHSQLFDQYFREYSQVSPFKHDQDQSHENLVDGPAQVLKEAEAFRRNIDFNDRVAAKNLEVREVHRRIDDLCRNIPGEYLKMRENVDFRIQRIRKDIENELSSMSFEPPKPAKEQPPKAKGKFLPNQKGSRVTLKEHLPKSYPPQKPIASVKPNGHKLQTSAPTVRQTIARKPQTATEAPVTISPAQLAYQNLILERQRQYLQKLEAMQHLPPGSSIQSAGLVYNKNFYPIKGQIIQAVPETKEAATETKFGVEKEIQTTEPPKSGKRVDFENVVSTKHGMMPEKRLAIENLPEVVIESEEKPILERGEEESLVEEPSLSDIIIAPGYRKPNEPPRPPIAIENKNMAFSRVQACIEDEIVSNILRKIITGPPTETVNQTLNDEESDESSLSPENELILQIFIDAGINIDKRLVRKIGEEEIMKMILAIIEEQEHNKLKEDLGKCNIGMPRVPTPNQTPREYSPEESEKESPIGTPRPIPVKTQLVDRSISPFVQASETSEGSSSGDDFMAHVQQDGTADHFIPMPQPNVETPERTPPIESPESSVVEVSITSEVPPSPEKTAPAKIPEPAVPPVIAEDTECVDIGIQYEAPPSFKDCQTSPMFSKSPERVPTATESSSTSSSDYRSVYTPTTEEPMSDHEWVVPHEVLRSEGEFTPPHRVKFQQMPMPGKKFSAFQVCCIDIPIF